MAGALENLMRVFTYSKIGVNFVTVDVASHIFDLWVELSNAGHCGGIRLQSGHC